MDHLSLNFVLRVGYGSEMGTKRILWLIDIPGFVHIYMGRNSSDEGAEIILDVILLTINNACDVVLVTIDDTCSSTSKFHQKE